MKSPVLLLSTILLVFLFTTPSYSFSKKANPGSGLTAIDNFSPKDFISMSYQEFSHLTGQKKNFINRFAFRMAKNKIRHELKKNPSLKLSEFNSAYKKRVSVFGVVKIIILVILVFLLIVALVYSGKHHNG